MQTVGDKTLISGLRSYAWTVRATNYGRWCRWWLQSNRQYAAYFTVEASKDALSPC